MLWTLRGKSAWETAVILGISEHTVVKILRSATGKLDAPNKQSAALKAMMLGLLDEAEQLTPRSESPGRPAKAHGASPGPDTAASTTTDPRCDLQAWPAVEVAPGTLAQLAFTHLATDCIETSQSSAVHAPAAISPALSTRGRTTWTADLRGATVLVQWHWVIEQSGIVLIENPLAVTTNAFMSCDARVAQPPERPLLLECMRVIHLLGWHEVVRSAAGNEAQQANAS